MLLSSGTVSIPIAIPVLAWVQEIQAHGCGIKNPPVVAIVRQTDEHPFISDVLHPSRENGTATLRHPPERYAVRALEGTPGAG
jgi:hypothetical protein